MGKVQLAHELAWFLCMVMSSQGIKLAHVNLKIGIQYHKYMFKIKGAEVVKMSENSNFTETKKISM